MWRAATASHVNAWEKIMLEIKGVNEEAFKHFIKIPPRFWSKSRFRTSTGCGSLVNNMPEEFNSVFVAARAKPIVTMLEEIRVYIMQIGKILTNMKTQYYQTSKRG